MLFDTGTMIGSQAFAVFCLLSLASGYAHDKFTPSQLRRQLTFNGKITMLQLFDATKDTKIVDLANGTVVNLKDIPGMTSPSFNINAAFADNVRSVTYGYNNAKYRVEEIAPFAFCANNRTDFFKCDKLGCGNHTVSAMPYSRGGGRGDAGPAYTVSFSIVCPSPVAPPVAMPVTPPVAAPVARPVAPPVVAPAVSPVTPVAPPVVAPVATPVKAPVAPPVQAPVPVAPPVQAPVPVAPPVQAPVPVAPPVQAPVPVAPPVQAPVPVPVAPPVQAPVPVPVAPPVQAPVPVPVAPPVPAPMAPPTPAPLKITAFGLINADKDTKILDIVNGTIVNIKDIPGMSTPSFNINATFTGAVRSVVYLYNNAKYSVEEAIPYAFCNNNKADFFKCRQLACGNHTVSAVPYPRGSGQGDAGTSYTVSFSIVCY